VTSQITPLARGLLEELLKEDQALVEAAGELEQARTRYQVASRKYAAVRDVVSAHLGRDPYALSLFSLGFYQDFPSKGRYRFLHMSPGDATVAALKESEEPMTLEEIIEKLASGGLRAPGMARMMNAALMRTTGVQKTEDGRYRYEAADPDDLPFE
jgi:hypothetical protein